MDTISGQLSWTASGADWRTTILITIALLVYPALPLRAGEIYKSVDAEGHVVYSDRPDTSMAQQSPVQIPSSEPVADIAQRTSEPPPPLPDNQQPSCPEEGDLWTPGYWAWNGAGYYWVPGAWVEPPQLDVLWTPGYWEYVDAVFVFHRGHWGEHVGYYGGINYGFGYFGVGFAGGRWINHSFAYNRSVSNVDAHVIRSTYSESVHAAVNRVSYNGGPGGTTSLMTAREKSLEAEKHLPPTPAQRRYLAPRMPISVYHTQPSAEPRNIEATQKPASLNAPAMTGSRPTVAQSPGRQHELVRTPPTNRAPAQPAVARPGKPKSAPAKLSLRPN